MVFVHSPEEWRVWLRIWEIRVQAIMAGLRGMPDERQCLSSTIFFRELDVVEPMSPDEEQRLLMEQEQERFCILESILSIDRGRRMFFQPLRELARGGSPSVRIVDETFWQGPDGSLSRSRGKKIESLLDRLKGRYLNRETVRELHLSWHSVENMGRELFSGMDRCRQLLARRKNLADTVGNNNEPAFSAAVSFHMMSSGSIQNGYLAWDLHPRMASIQNELYLIEVWTGTGLHGYSSAEIKFRKALQRCREIAERFVEANLGLVVSKVRKYYPCSIMDEMDLVQEGCQGLMEAVRRYDRRRGCKLSTYAIWWIRQFIMKAILNHGRIVRIPANVHRADSRIRRAIDEFILENGFEPSIGELASFMGEDRAEIENIYISTAPPLSLDHTDPEHDATIADFLESRFQPPDVAAVQSDLRERIDIALRSLSDREKTIVTLRFGLLDREPCTLGQVGRIFGLSRERVRQIESKALEKLGSHGLISSIAGES